MNTSIKDSFVLYLSMFENLKEVEDIKDRWRIFESICNFAFFEEQPNLNDFDIMGKVIIRSTLPLIAASKRNYENGCKGGRGKKKESQKESGVLTPLLTPVLTENKSGVFTNDNDNEKDNVNENVKEKTPEAALPDSLSPSLYASKIFRIFKEAGLPCASNNQISFMQRDFKNALSFIHSSSELRGLHSDEVIAACKNYVECLKNSETYLSNKYSFERFVKLKNFADFLPSNFVMDNFKKWDTETKEEKKEAKDFKPAEDIFQKLKAPSKCANCGEAVTNYGGGGYYAVKCNKCNNFAEYDPLSKCWNWAQGVSA